MMLTRVQRNFQKVNTRTFATTPQSSLPQAVLIDGVRIPFQTSGTGYKNLLAHDLGRMALQGLLNKTAIEPSKIDQLIMGTVIQESKTSNVARESALGAGIPNSVPCHTVTMACISSNKAISTGVDAIKAGQSEIVVASGTETMSDVPIRLSRALRARLLASQKVKSFGGYLNLLKGLKMSDITVELPAIAEFSTGETMGKSADRLAAAFKVSRREQDEFALASHLRAFEAHKKGLYQDEIVPALVPPTFGPVTNENGVRGDSTYEKMASLKPAFIKPHGTVTAANASFLTDGASATLLMSEKKALELGYKPKAILKEYVYAAQDPKEELLLGPAYATARLLQKLGLTLKDIDVWEFHEAFAGQVLAVMKALDSEQFCKDKIQVKSKVGLVPFEKLNTLGGSLSLGHPFGATGCRLVTTAANRLIRENGQYAVIAACAAGGLGHAMVIQRYPQ
eukprot:TRINITY_DN1702_c0_g1_i1.p1 TRINITY_DN1702_c0_g1~~TRINITY_DN1702_c0_g1_i1.p1  ORF type:complete len:453 (-),score=164.74 TRINITY_DN1702_c0_g1_i1:151-1509(-)